MIIEWIQSIMRTGEDQIVTAPPSSIATGSTVMMRRKSLVAVSVLGVTPIDHLIQTQKNDIAFWMAAEEEKLMLTLNGSHIMMKEEDPVKILVDAPSILKGEVVVVMNGSSIAVMKTNP